MRWLFWLSFAFIAYTYVGYAVWLWLRGWLRPWPVQRGSYEPPVSVVLVVRNEEQTLRDKLRNLGELEYPAERLQVVIVSDGSTDGTETILREYANHPRVHLLMNQFPQGKACSLNDAMTVVAGDVVVFTDARQKIEPQAVRRLMENLADANVGCVSGELMLGDPGSGESARGMGLYWRIEKRMRELESRSGSLVGATGALYAMRREFVMPLPSGTILDDVYLPMQVVCQGKRVVFEPQARAWDSANLGTDREFSRKVRTLSGNYQLLQLAPWLLSGSNPIRFEFISHKLLRLAIPFAMAAMFATSLLLPGILYRAALILQLAFYGLSLLGMMQLNRGPVGRLADAALTFVVLHVAAAVAFAKFVTGRTPVWTR